MGRDELVASNGSRAEGRASGDGRRPTRWGRGARRPGRAFCGETWDALSTLKLLTLRRATERGRRLGAPHSAAPHGLAPGDGGARAPAGHRSAWRRSAGVGRQEARPGDERRHGPIAALGERTMGARRLVLQFATVLLGEPWRTSAGRAEAGGRVRDSGRRPGTNAARATRRRGTDGSAVGTPAVARKTTKGRPARLARDWACIGERGSRAGGDGTQEGCTRGEGARECHPGRARESVPSGRVRAGQSAWSQHAARKARGGRPSVDHGLGCTTRDWDQVVGQARTGLTGGRRA